MCQKAPGPRCAAHAKPAMDKALQKLAAFRNRHGDYEKAARNNRAAYYDGDADLETYQETAAAIQKIRETERQLSREYHEAQADYYGTPTGVAELQARVDAAEAAGKRDINAEAMIRAATTRRQERIEAKRIQDQVESRLAQLEMPGSVEDVVDGTDIGYYQARFEAAERDLEEAKARAKAGQKAVKEYFKETGLASYQKAVGDAEKAEQAATAEAFDTFREVVGRAAENDVDFNFTRDDIDGTDALIDAVYRQAHGTTAGEEAPDITSVRGREFEGTSGFDVEDIGGFDAEYFYDQISEDDYNKLQKSFDKMNAASKKTREKSSAYAEKWREVTDGKSPGQVPVIAASHRAHADMRECERRVHAAEREYQANRLRVGLGLKNKPEGQGEARYYHPPKGFLTYGSFSPWPNRLDKHPVKMNF